LMLFIALAANALKSSHYNSRLNPIAFFDLSK
jgi:hypothetical protein